MIQKNQDFIYVVAEAEILHEKTSFHILSKT
jgi:hypothetical protein